MALGWWVVCLVIRGIWSVERRSEAWPKSPKMQTTKTAVWIWMPLASVISIAQRSVMEAEEWSLVPFL